MAETMVLPRKLFSQLSKKELLDAFRPRDRKAKKLEKQQIIDKFVAATG
jgi:hypothetical protein